MYEVKINQFKNRDMFSFFKRNKYGLSNAELDYAKQLNSDIQRVDLAVMLIDNLHTIANYIYLLSTRRARLKDYLNIINSTDEFSDIDLLMNEPQLLSHVEIHKTLRDEILKTSLMIIVHAVKFKHKSEEETFIMTQEVLSVLLEETANRLKSL